MSEKKQEKAFRRIYKKPRLEQVQLVLEESVLATCKTGTGGPLQQCKVSYCSKTPHAS